MTRRARLTLIVVVAISLGMGLSGIMGRLMAGEAPPAPAPAARPAPAPAAVAPGAMAESAQAFDSGMTLGKLWSVGGICMWPLAGLNIAVIALGVYGYLTVRESKMLLPQLVPTIQDALGKLHLDEAMNIAGSNPSVMTNVLHSGLQRLSDGVLDVSSLEKAMEEAAVEESAAGIKWIGYISVCAQLAPMVGLLGTVSGMIKAFQKIGKGGMGKPELLANDIGEALITTAYGLIVGIPAMWLYFNLKARYTGNLTRMNRVLGNLLHTLVSATRKGGEAAMPEPPAAPQRTV